VHAICGKEKAGYARFIIHTSAYKFHDCNDVVHRNMLINSPLWADFWPPLHLQPYVRAILVIFGREYLEDLH
jgi:hypothetical protein